jgi:hypothetical protein
MLETIMPYLARPVTDAEARLGAGLIDHLTQLGGEGLVDSTAEIGIAVMLAMYATHRRECGDLAALDRIVGNAREILRQGRFELRVGEDFAQMVAGEIAAGRVKP